MTIYERLEQDHDRHRKLLEKIARTEGSSEERQTLFAELKADVTAHANAEEQSLYAMMLEDPDLQEEGRHSVAEHKEVDDWLEELSETDMSSPAWIATFRKMKDRLEHHMEEEEEEIFIAAREKINGKKAEQLEDLFNARKADELAQA